jgi:hypothetical protein
MPSVSTRKASSIVTTRPASASFGPASGSTSILASAADPRRSAGRTGPVSGNHFRSIVTTGFPSGR